MLKPTNRALISVAGCSLGLALLASAWAQQSTQQAGQVAPKASPSPSPSPTASPSPSPTPTLASIYDTLLTLPQYSSLVSALNQAGVAKILQGGGPYTFFAPNNDAFISLNSVDDDALPELAEDPSKLSKILMYHIVPGTAYSSSQLAGIGSLPTLEGQNLTLSVSGGTITIANVPDIPSAAIVQPDIPASNGTIQGVNQIVYPPGTGV